MPHEPPFVLPQEQAQLTALGERLRLARRRRGLRSTDMAMQAGVSRSTVYKVEAGDPGATLGAYFRVLEALGLGSDLDKLGADDIGGLVTRHTVTEQLLYEIHDPSTYLTPDVTLDITGVELTETGPDCVQVDGARGRPAPERLKVTVSHDAGWFGEAEISYAGPNALARARLALDVIRRRMPEGVRMRADLIGVASVFNDDAGEWLERHGADPLAARDIRLRIALSAPERALAARAPEEVLALYCAGPAGGGGVRSSLRRRISTSSGYIRRERVRPAVEILE